MFEEFIKTHEYVWYIITGIGFLGVVIGILIPGIKAFIDDIK